MLMEERTLLQRSERSEANYPALLQGKSLKATSNPDPTEGISEGELYSYVFRLPIGLEPIMVTIAVVSVHPSRLLHSTIQAGDGMARFRFRPPTGMDKNLRPSQRFEESAI